MKNLIKKELACFNHNKFWASLDTQKDKKYFNDLWKNKKFIGIRNC